MTVSEEVRCTYFNHYFINFPYLVPCHAPTTWSHFVGDSALHHRLCPCPSQQRYCALDWLISAREAHTDTKLSCRDPPLLRCNVPIRHVPSCDRKANNSRAVGRQVPLFKPAECLWRSSRWNTRLRQSNVELCDGCSGGGACVRQGHGDGYEWRV